MSSRPLALLLLTLAPLAGCGGGASEYASDYEGEVAAACREFNDAAFKEQVSGERAREIYAGFERDLGRLSPPDDLGRTHDALLRLARGGREAFTGDPPPDDITFDLSLSVGDWEDEGPRIKRRLPDCADSLTNTHPEIQVIR